MLLDLFRAFQSGITGIRMAELLVELAAVVFVVLFCLAAHECAHAWAAKKLGDSTAYNHGRLTLNPGKHLDPIGSLMILVIGFGYAKPVPVNPRNFKKYKQGMALTAIAGPISNLLIAVFFSLIYNIVLRYVFMPSPNDFTYLLYRFFYAIFYTNVSLAVFNLLPIPPLDGSRLLDLFLPARASMFLARYERYLVYGVLALLLLGVLTVPLEFFSDLIVRGIDYLTKLPFRLLP